MTFCQNPCNSMALLVFLYVKNRGLNPLFIFVTTVDFFKITK